MRIAIVGQGYVGLAATHACVRVGHKVTGIDKNESIVSSLNRGISHIEGIPSEDIANALQESLFKATQDYSEISDAEVVLIAVPTPLDQKGKPDLSLIESVTDSIAPYLGEKSLVINESTSFIGTLRNVVIARIKRLNPEVHLFAISPERVDPGNPVYHISNTPRLVGGISPESTSLAVDFYSTFCNEVVPVSSPEVAEAAKLLENSFRYVNIGFINEFTKILNSLGISTSEVISAASTKPYGFMPFFPNVGIGGHCIPVDPLYLQKNALDVGVPSKYIELSELTDRHMPNYSIDRLESIHGSIMGKKVLIIGVTYKPNISDTRESPAEHIIEILRKRGAKVNWHDPLVNEYLGETSSNISDDYDLALVLVKHDHLDLSSWRGGPIYCVRKSDSNAGWISILDAEVKQ
jgi:UDP-N-acetyl-D-glucosamine dehydrogenase